MTAVMGGDRETPLPSTTYAAPRPKPKGLDWSKHTAPAPVSAAAPAPSESAQAAVDDVRRRLQQPAPRRAATPRARPTGRPRTVPAGEAAVIVAEYVAGGFVDELARKHKRSRETIYRLVDEAGAERRGASMRTFPRVADDADKVAQVLRMYTVDGLTQDEIASRLGHAPITIRGILHDHDARRPDALPGQPRTRGRQVSIDLPSAVAAYEAGATIPQIARDRGYRVRSLRVAFARAGVSMRDDRKLALGARRSRVDVVRPGLVDEVRRLYVDEGMSQAKVAARLGVSLNAVARTMKRHQIPTRERQHGVGDTLGRYRARLERLGITVADLRAWAVENGHAVPVRGLPRATVLDAYEAAHR